MRRDNRLGKGALLADHKKTDAFAASVPTYLTGEHLFSHESDLPTEIGYGY